MTHPLTRSAAALACGRTFFSILAMTMAACAGSAGAFGAEADVVLALSARDGRMAFSATGLTAEFLAPLASGEAPPREAFAVGVDSAGGQAAPPMLGVYEVDGEVLWFTPRFPLRPGLSYRAVVRPGEARIATKVFAIPRSAPRPPVRVTAIYPSVAHVPENLLKLYLHFSAPVRQGTLFRYVQLADTEGNLVERPFVEIDQELWDRSGTRLTLLFDPGRVKRGLVPREQFGPILEEGKTYNVTIDPAWPDAEGRPLAELFSRTFTVGPPDDQQPRIEDWIVQSPLADSRAPLRIELDEPLDHAMLHRVLTVLDASGEPIAGEVVTALAESVWLFTPDAPWKAGRCRLVVDDDLEDLTGNSLGRPFELDLFERVDDGPIDRTVSLDFVVE